MMDSDLDRGKLLRSSSSGISTGILVGCAVVLTALVARREFRDVVPSEPPEQRIQDWERTLTEGNRIWFDLRTNANS
jgi:hypothetical protein